MEGSVPYTVILQSIKIPCLKKRWEMAAIQKLGAWDSICWSKFPFGLRENKSLNNSSRPWPAGVCEDNLLLQMSPPARGGSHPQGYRATRTRSSWKLPASCCITSRGSSGPSPSPDVLHKEQEPGAALASCPLKARRTYVCAEDMSHFWLSGATVMGYTDKHKDWKLVVYALKEKAKYFIFQV